MDLTEEDDSPNSDDNIQIKIEQPIPLDFIMPLTLTGPEFFNLASKIVPNEFAIGLKIS